MQMSFTKKNLFDDSFLFLGAFLESAIFGNILDKYLCVLILKREITYNFKEIFLNSKLEIISKKVEENNA